MKLVYKIRVVSQTGMENKDLLFVFIIISLIVILLKNVIIRIYIYIFTVDAIFGQPNVYHCSTIKYVL